MARLQSEVVTKDVLSYSEELKKAVAVLEEKIQQRSPKARPIFQQPFSLPESAQTLAGIAFRAAGKSARDFGQPQPSRVF